MRIPEPEAAPKPAKKQKVSQKKERTPGVCFDFQRGECDRGDECRFSHDPDVVAAAGPAPERGPPRGGEKLDEICNNFLAGKCRYGDDCRRIH